jgi:hypothetical protein
MAIDVGRRKFISALGSTALAWPLAAGAETVRRLGLLFATSEQAAKARGLLEAVTKGLKEYGWVEGESITFEYRFADGKDDVLPKLASGNWFSCDWTHIDGQQPGNPSRKKCHANRTDRHGGE